ncbi:MAG: hypothetical protein ACRDMI_16515, partial [Streptosporangiaceae bacterium]
MTAPIRTRPLLVTSIDIRLVRSRRPLPQDPRTGVADSCRAPKIAPLSPPSAGIPGPPDAGAADLLEPLNGTRPGPP